MRRDLLVLTALTFIAAAVLRSWFVADIGSEALSDVRAPRGDEFSTLRDEVKCPSCPDG